MSDSAAIALRAAIHATLSADESLTALLGGVRIYDHPPRGAQTPYVVFDDFQSRDWSTASNPGVEHLVRIAVLSIQGGAREALAIAERARALLDNASPSLAGHALVDLRFTQLDTRRETNGRFTRVTLRFRAVTEPL